MSAARRNNAKGRDNTGKDQPRPLVPLEIELLNLMGRKQRTRGENGREEEITLGEAVLRKAIQSALAGSVHAQRTLIKLTTAAEAVTQAERRDRAAYWRQVRIDRQRHLEEWRRQGRQELDFVLHPDDIVISADDTVAFNGPVDEAELARVRGTVEARSVFLMIAQYEDRPGVLDAQAMAEGGSSALLLCCLMNAFLPPRLRWSTAEMVQQYFTSPGWRTRRQAQTAVRARLRGQGIVMRRNATLPPLDRMRAFVEEIVTLTTRLVEDGASGNVWSIDRIVEELTRIYRPLNEGRAGSERA